jgi:hypothetical protein
MSTATDIILRRIFKARVLPLFVHLKCLAFLVLGVANGAPYIRDGTLSFVSEQRGVRFPVKINEGGTQFRLVLALVDMIQVQKV